MKKKRIFGKLILVFATASLFCLMLSLSVSAAQKYNFPEGAADVNITLNSRAVLDGEAAIIDSVTYVPLRSFSELCGANSVSWDASTRTATVKKYNLVAKISDRKNYIEANGRYIYLTAPVKNIDDRLFVPIRPISLIFSLDVDWWRSWAAKLKSCGSGKMRISSPVEPSFGKELSPGSPGGIWCRSSSTNT